MSYRLLFNCVGEHWAIKISNKCSGRNKSRLTVPFSNHKGHIKKFIRFIGDEEIANKLINEFGGQRIYVGRFARNVQRKEIHKVIEILQNNGLNKEQIQATVIRADTEFYGYQRKRSKKQKNKQQLELVI